MAPNDLRSIGMNYVLFFVIEFVIWNIGFRQSIDVLEYLLPIFPAVGFRVVSRWRRSKPPAKQELDSLIGREERLRLIHRVDENYRKVEVGREPAVPY